MNKIDLYVILLCLITIMEIGVLFSSRSNKPESFIITGRSLSHWLLVFSIFSIQVSNITFIGITGKSFISIL